MWELVATCLLVAGLIVGLRLREQPDSCERCWWSGFKWCYSHWRVWSSITAYFFVFEMTVKLPCFWNLSFWKLSGCKARTCFFGNGVHVNELYYCIHSIYSFVGLRIRLQCREQKMGTLIQGVGGYYARIRYCKILLLPCNAHSRFKHFCKQAGTIKFRYAFYIKHSEHLDVKKSTSPYCSVKAFFPSWIGIITLYFFCGGLGNGCKS